MASRDRDRYRSGDRGVDEVTADFDRLSGGGDRDRGGGDRGGGDRHGDARSGGGRSGSGDGGDGDHFKGDAYGGRTAGALGSYGDRPGSSSSRDHDPRAARIAEEKSGRPASARHTPRDELVIEEFDDDDDDARWDAPKCRAEARPPVDDALKRRGGRCDARDERSGRVASDDDFGVRGRDAPHSNTPRAAGISLDKARTHDARAALNRSSSSDRSAPYVGGRDANESRRDADTRFKVPGRLQTEASSFRAYDDDDDRRYSKTKPRLCRDDDADDRRRPQRRDDAARHPMPSRDAASAAITLSAASTLRTLLNGSTRRAMPLAWREQGFCFSKVRHLQFGLVQHDGGPCGVLAAVQAHVLDELLRECRTRCDEWDGDPSPKAQAKALTTALARVLWRAGGGLRAKLCVPSDRAYFDRTAVYNPDGVTERVKVWTTFTFEDLKQLVSKHLPAFLMPKGPGVLLAVYSVLLSRGVSDSCADMDVEFDGATRSLLDGHGYAKQELINLFMCGRAHSNVFDGERVMDDEDQGSCDTITLRGVPARADFGFLSLAEAYGHVRVGTNYKDPRSPVWVVYAESHYSVLFSVDAACEGDVFDLFYWDGLSDQEDVIRLSVDKRFFENTKPPDVDDARALIPPLDLVLRSKWASAGVDWNGTEAIL
ncbi:hypothetical protein M885DRAFT_535032 [Pelagophyceae sp. CCMP2097]|nr:hypothetical protein M885DRAFT_535032 [Pelagophyceae sp. CCMP2097]